jgi:hypothetical protein
METYVLIGETQFNDILGPYVFFDKEPEIEKVQFLLNRDYPYYAEYDPNGEYVVWNIYSAKVEEAV